MLDSASPSALAGRHLLGGHRAPIAAFCWTFACLLTALAIYGLIGLIGAQSERDAGRLSSDAQSGKAYVALVVGALAARHGRAAQ